MKNIPLNTLLTRIGLHLYIIQQYKNLPSSVYNAHISAQALIELAELETCGSIGGYASGQPDPKDLFDRWDYMVREYMTTDPETNEHLEEYYNAVKRYYKG